jgi:UDP-N-acetylmuramate dehydrogenase
VTDALRRAESILRAACGDRLRTGFPLAPLTSFRIGGPASLYLEPESERDLVAAGEAVRHTDVPVVVMGKGSNILVADRGFEGLVLRLGRGYRWAARTGDRITAGGAMPLPALAGVALSHRLTGLEFGVAIPASFGGAIRMNAGAHGHEVAEAVESVDVFELALQTGRVMSAPEIGFRYRNSELPADAVVVAGTVRLASADTSQIRRLMEEAREWRRRTQPLAEPNCGSVFKNPPGDHAARLIEDAGGKALSVGGAAVSAKHANFIVAGEGTSASDVVELVRKLQDVVEARSGVRLEPEVHLVGRFDLAPR